MSARILPYPMERRDRWHEYQAALYALEQAMSHLNPLQTFAAEHYQRALDEVYRTRQAYLEAGGERARRG